MRPQALPGFGVVLRAESPDRVFDLFMLLGPLVVIVIAVTGRTSWTVSLAAAYVGGLVLYVAYKGYATRARRSP